MPSRLIFPHLEVVHACAPMCIHVMVEKPLAVSLDHAVKTKTLAEKHKIFLLPNYETTWYATSQLISAIYPPEFYIK